MSVTCVYPTMRRKWGTMTTTFAGWFKVLRCCILFTPKCLAECSFSVLYTALLCSWALSRKKFHKDWKALLQIQGASNSYPAYHSFGLTKFSGCVAFGDNPNAAADTKCCCETAGKMLLMYNYIYIKGATLVGFLAQFKLLVIIFKALWSTHFY